VGQTAGSKIKLKFYTNVGSPTSLPAQTNGSSSATPINGTSRSRRFASASSASNVEQLEGAKSAQDTASPSEAKPALAVSVEGGSTALESVRPSSQAESTPGLQGSGMPPPSTPGLTPQQSQGGHVQSSNDIPPAAVQEMAVDPRFRAPGESKSCPKMTEIISAHYRSRRRRLHCERYYCFTPDSQYRGSLQARIPSK
jgi:hypothetical protein